MTPAFKPNAISASQVARLVGCSPQNVDLEIKREDSRLETFDFAGSRMVTMRSVRRWQAARIKAATNRAAKLTSQADPEILR
jgi:hypothetical protein